MRVERRRQSRAREGRPGRFASLICGVGEEAPPPTPRCGATSPVGTGEGGRPGRFASLICGVGQEAPPPTPRCGATSPVGSGEGGVGWSVMGAPVCFGGAGELEGGEDGEEEGGLDADEEGLPGLE